MGVSKSESQVNKIGRLLTGALIKPDAELSTLIMPGYVILIPNFGQHVGRTAAKPDFYYFLLDSR